MSLDKKVYGALRKYTDEKVKRIQTGNVTVEKTSDGVVFIAHKGEATETRAEFTRDELRGLGVQSFSKDENGYTIVTYTDGSIQNIGQWNGKNAAVEVVADTNFKYILKFSYYDENDNLIEITTPNLRQNKVEIVPNTSNTENSYKLDINTYDAEGNKSTVTSDELMAEKYEISQKATNNKYDYRLNIEKTKNDGTKEIKTTSNLKGNEIWIGTELIGDEAISEVLAEDGKSYSRVNDIYINSDTNDIYRRTDKNDINNVWEKVGNIKGLQGDDAYEVAVGEGFMGTRSEWLKSLMGESLGSQIVWDKPSIHEETTLLKVWYYYKQDSYEYGEGSAWLNRYNIPSDKDYEPNTYSFFNGINYLTFTSTMATIPSSTQKDIYQFYVLYDEKNSKVRVHSVNKETNEDTSLGEWLDIIKSSTKPEDSELVIPEGEIIQYGTWVQTIYLGNSKDNAYDCTIKTGADVSGFVTEETFDNVVGADNLKTDNQKVKSAINEIFDMIKANKNTVLETTNKSLFEAVNELHKKKNIDCYELKDEDLLAHCLSDNYEMLSCNFIYAENCTNVPKDNNGYGYAMLIISQDTHYRQVVFFDPTNGKISTNNIGANADNTAFGNWSGWDSPSNHTVPIGSIQAYYGRAMGLSIPDGWALCNGSTINDSDSPLNGKTLPNLSSKVLAMAPVEGLIGSTVGANTIKLNRNQLPNAVLETSGTLTYTPKGTVSINSNGAHTHSYSRISPTYSHVKKDANDNWGYTGQWDSGTTGSNGNHNHSATFTGASQTLVLSTSGNLNGGVTQQYINNMQDTMYVDYIMKIK